MSHSSEGNIWKLSYPELAQLCQQIAHNPSKNLDPAVREEARRIHTGWSDALGINTHEEGAAARQASMALALRKRTIELILKTEQAAG
jgi:carboxylesterase type B